MKSLISKRVITSAILASSILFNHSSVFASEFNISSVTEIDLSNGEITGENVEFKLILPNKWTDFIISYREELNGNPKLLEKINFNYRPVDKISKPIALMDFYIFNKNVLDDNYFDYNENLEVVLETNDHIFATALTNSINIENENDNELYGNLVDDFKKSSFYNEFIKLPQGTESLDRMTLTIDDEKLLGRNILKLDDGVFIPLRKSCEYLGFKVLWSAIGNRINITNDDINFSFRVSDDANSVGFTSINHKGTTYVDTLFFSNILNYEVDTDEKYNITIIT